MTTILKFHADWCGPCKAIAPVVEGMISKRADLELVNVDIDKEPEEAARYNVRSIPTLVMVKDDGSIVNTLTGNQSAEKIREFVDSASSQGAI